MSRPPRVAVIGAGPSGLYAAAALLASETPVEVDVLDRLPAPYGLVRYGVAPDHIRMKSVIPVLRKPFAVGSRIRFLGNVCLGEHGLVLDTLRRHYHAVIHASGSSRDRRLGIPGEDLDGSHGSRALVGWYSGHPDFTALDPRLDHSGVVVVGAGNVALDIARVLTRDVADMARTDVPDHVLKSLQQSSVRDVHVVIRRSPEHVKFTPPELRQIGELDDVSVLVHNGGAIAGRAGEPADRRQRQNMRLLDGWAKAGGQPARRRIHLHFQRSPVRVAGGDGKVTGVVVERNEIRDGRLVGTGREETIEAGLVVRAIGYSGEPIGGLPFDEAAGVVPNVAGRVLRDGNVVPGQYVTGWIKRGPSGVIGTNKGDAGQTVSSLLADLAGLPAPAHPEPESITECLGTLGFDVVAWEHWESLDVEEIRLGRVRGCAERVKVAGLDAMMRACRTPSEDRQETAVG
ncbi:FAD-dependent oxidoreductase [Amycolatopsis alkalitolerans]|uniref:ferredoxin--NADP(+) reductase n=1 Tax=Amycolatopsis alkalitolerans TaxID=2547244 RepID=A0A5C4LRU1_9PSEU|nr:FAD-dependent oxidoreductase [Amycolatopsis alkalitolerans]TNC18722.1 pyridine nucleotide-disulfide oxidoreductase [Amycolatopsis alkalitolerans]